MLRLLSHDPGHTAPAAGHVGVAMLSLCAAGLTGCPPAEQQQPTAGTSTSEPGSTSEATTSGPSSSGSTIDPPTTTAETTPAATCPDGNVDADEACDDGNSVNGDGCNNDCQPSGTQLSEYRVDESGSTQVFSIAADADASIVVGGRGTGLSRWVARFGPDLVPQWAKKYEEEVYGLVRGVGLGDGVIYAAGSRSSDSDGHDLWVAGLSPDGALVWEDTLSGGMGDDWATQAAVVDGDLVVAGLALGDQIWTRRYGADGAIQWTATFPIGNTYNNIYPLGPGLTTTPEAIIVGWRSSKPMEQSPELLIAYPHGGGAPLWTVELPGTRGSINALAADPGGDLVLATLHEFAALMVRRTTSAGGVLWSSAECGGAVARDVAIDGQGDIVVIGDGPGGIGDNIRLCKFTVEGGLRWGRDIDGGFGDDLGYAVAIDPADRVVAGGAMADDQGKKDTWLAVFSP
jgi:cysteine-rich repeat protein